jgi:hypothetical protein
MIDTMDGIINEDNLEEEEETDDHVGIISICRVNAFRQLDSTDESIQTTRDRNEVCLKDQSKIKPAFRTSCDAVLDDTSPKSKDNGARSSFASQDVVWKVFLNALESSISSQKPSISSAISVVAVGGPQSGKSHTLFGDVKFQEKEGIVSRFIHHCFSNDFEFNKSRSKLIQISMLLLLEEQIIDLFKPESSKLSCSDSQSMVYSTTVGPMITGTQLIAFSALQGVEMLTLGTICTHINRIRTIHSSICMRIY